MRKRGCLPRPAHPIYQSLPHQLVDDLAELMCTLVHDSCGEGLVPMEGFVPSCGIKWCILFTSNLLLVCVITPNVMSFGGSSGLSPPEMQVVSHT